MVVCGGILVSSLVAKQYIAHYTAEQGWNALVSKYCVLFWRIQFQEVQVGTFEEKGKKLKTSECGGKKSIIFSIRMHLC